MKCQLICLSYLVILNDQFDFNQQERVSGYLLIGQTEGMMNKAERQKVF